MRLEVMAAVIDMTFKDALDIIDFKEAIELTNTFLTYQCLSDHPDMHNIAFMTLVEHALYLQDPETPKQNGGLPACPNCNMQLDTGTMDPPRYCRRCGKHITWREVKTHD